MPILQVHFVQTFRLKTLPSHQQGYVSRRMELPIPTQHSLHSFGTRLAQALMPTSLHIYIPMKELECSYLSAIALFLNIVF